MHVNASTNIDSTGARGMACVLVLDLNERRRGLLATEFRSAGFRVFEGMGMHDARRTLKSFPLGPWIIAIADTSPVRGADALVSQLGEAYPDVPTVVIGMRRQRSIVGRITIDRSPELATRVHSLVDLPFDVPL